MELWLAIVPAVPSDNLQIWHYEKLRIFYYFEYLIKMVMWNEYSTEQEFSVSVNRVYVVQFCAIYVARIWHVLISYLECFPKMKNTMTSILHCILLKWVVFDLRITFCIISQMRFIELKIIWTVESPNC